MARCNHVCWVIDCLTLLCNVDSSIAFIGDLNFPSIDWSNLNFVTENERCSILFSIFSKQHCFEQLVGESTYLSPTGNGSLLDIILCNDPFIISDVTVSCPFSISDHFTVNFKILGTSGSSTLPAHELRDFSNADWNSISEFLTNCDWHTIFIDCITCDDFIAAFYTKLNEAIASFVPLKVFRSTTSTHHLSYPLHIRKLYRAKSSIWRRFKQFKTLALKQQYAAISSRCREAVHNYVAKREENIINSGNLGKFFRYANSKFSHKSSVGPLLDANGNKTIDPEIKASLLSKYFHSQFTNDNQIIPGMQPRSSAITGLSSIILHPL